MSKLSESYKFDTDKCILHIGAHECEELSFYNQLGLKEEDIIWVDAINEKVDWQFNFYYYL